MFAVTLTQVDPAIKASGSTNVEGLWYFSTLATFVGL